VQKKIRIIHAPTNLGLNRRPDGMARGCNKLPDALEEVGFHAAIGGEIVTSLLQPRYPSFPSYDEGTLFGRQIAAYSVQLADAVEDVWHANTFPLILGGDCSVLVGSSLALARRGRYGLLHFDAHPDYYHKGNKEQSVVAGMDLAIVTGKGPDFLINLENLKPYIQCDHALTFGYRESDPERDIVEEAISDGITCISAERFHRAGFAKTIEEITKFIEQRDVDGFWLHLDADILDKSIMPCVDCPEPGGLQWSELSNVLLALLETGKIVGMNVTILDPELDSTGLVTKAFSDMLIEGLGRSEI